jgi:hypothetical protein
VAEAEAGSEGAAVEAGVGSEEAAPRADFPEADAPLHDRVAAAEESRVAEAAVVLSIAGRVLPEVGASEAAPESQTGRRSNPVPARPLAAREWDRDPRLAAELARPAFRSSLRPAPADRERALPIVSALAQAHDRARSRVWEAARVETAFKICPRRAKTASPVFRIAWLAAIG